MGRLAGLRPKLNYLETLVKIHAPLLGCCRGFDSARCVKREEELKVDSVAIAEFGLLRPGRQTFHKNPELSHTP